MAESHPRPRPAPTPSTRPAVGHNEKYVDAKTGNDQSDGSAKAPWKTAAHAIEQLQPGDTLYLRQGTYHEHLTVAVSGKAEAPITIRSYPGELATIDGGIPEFTDAPATAWQPVEGKDGQYRSAKPHRNLRDVIGTFGDSLVGLQTYWHKEDLEATNELWDAAGKEEIGPVYCGPGVYYDDETGYLYARLASTHLEGNAVNYTGEADPRKLPLILAPFRSIPLHVDQGSHLRFQDLVIQGGGYDTVVVDHADDIVFDRVIVYCGTYGMRTANTTHLTFYRSALYGNTPPWGFRTENSLRHRKPTDGRDVARLTGHALWVADTGLEYSVYAYPPNTDFEISHSAFTDSHDGLYLGGIGVKFHHNLIDNMQDDGMYVSPVYNYGGGEQHIYENYFSRILTVFAFGGPVTNVKDTSVYIYRNIVDLRQPVRYGRPSHAKPKIEEMYGNVMGDHGSPPWTNLFVYQNTFLGGTTPRRLDMGTLGGKGEFKREILNNAFVINGKLPPYMPMPDPAMLDAGNLYWGTTGADKVAATFFEKYRKSPEYKKSEETNKVGSSTKSIVAEPKFTDPAKDDFRPAAGSPLVNAGVDVPSNLPDPLRAADAGAPDIGALPEGAPMLQAGINAPDTH